MNQTVYDKFAKTWAQREGINTDTGGRGLVTVNGREQSDVVMAPPPGGVINQRHYSAFYKSSTFWVSDGRNPFNNWEKIRIHLVL